MDTEATASDIVHDSLQSLGDKQESDKDKEGDGEGDVVEKEATASDIESLGEASLTTLCDYAQLTTTVENTHDWNQDCETDGFSNTVEDTNDWNQFF